MTAWEEWALRGAASATTAPMNAAPRSHAMTSDEVAWRRYIARPSIVVRRTAQPTIAVRREESPVIVVRIT